MSLREAYASCARIASGHYENFPVASLFLPRAMRPHVAAVYAFARAADDFADEGSLSADDRLTLLDGWRDRLHLAAAGAPDLSTPSDGEPSNTTEIFMALGATIHDRKLPVSLFEDLLSAFSQDTTVRRYQTWDDLLDYCRRSANPVGRLVLRIAGYADAQRDAWSDCICTALQLTNFWQDARQDYDRGRIYLPLDVLASHGATGEDLDRSVMPPPMRAALADVASRTRKLFIAGRPLCNQIGGRLRFELRATWLGGVRILSLVEQAGHNAPSARPRLRPVDAPWLIWNLAAWPAGPRS